jgi:hypothetical protein
MYNIAIQHGEEQSLAEVFRATSLLFSAFGNREFVALEVSEYIKRLATFGPSVTIGHTIRGHSALDPAMPGHPLNRHRSEWRRSDGTIRYGVQTHLAAR